VRSLAWFAGMICCGAAVALAIVAIAKSKSNIEATGRLAALRAWALTPRESGNSLRLSRSRRARTPCQAASRRLARPPTS
jgi:hypothetical protein